MPFGPQTAGRALISGDKRSHGFPQGWRSGARFRAAGPQRQPHQAFGIPRQEKRHPGVLRPGQHSHLNQRASGVPVWSRPFQESTNASPRHQHQQRSHQPGLRAEARPRVSSALRHQEGRFKALWCAEFLPCGEARDVCGGQAGHHPPHRPRRCCRRPGERARSRRRARMTPRRKTVRRASGETTAIHFFSSNAVQLTTTVMGVGLGSPAGTSIRNRWPSGETAYRFRELPEAS